MAAGASELEVKQWLAQLRSADVARRIEAANQMAGLKPQREEVTQALKDAAGSDPDQTVRQAATAALAAQAAAPPEAPTESLPPPGGLAGGPAAGPSGAVNGQSHANDSPNFAFGVLAQLGLWGLGYIVLTSAGAQSYNSPPFQTWVLYNFPTIFLLLNGAVLVVALIRRRPRFALGMLAAYGFAFLLVVVAWIFVLITCGLGGAL
jgi:hypothetical protein